MERLKDLYGKYLRPFTSDLLRSLRLDINYTRGAGNKLFYQCEESGKEIEVIDAVGGYGANILGHKYKDIQDRACEAILKSSPNNTQASLRESASYLGKKLSELLEKETGQGPWISTLSNSGTEAVESALKQALIYYHKRNRTINIRFLNQLNELYIIERENSPSENKLRSIFNSVKSAVDDSWHDQIDSCKTLSDFCKFLSSYNQDSLNAIPQFLALEKSFHGKSLGSLAVSFNPQFKNYFYSNQLGLKTEFIKNNDLEHFKKGLASNLITVLVPAIKDGKIIIAPMQYSSIAGFILEPVQGEGGVNSVTEDFLQEVRKQATRNDFLLIFDEIQAGLYRTGKLASGSNFNCQADIYCFSKGLGGGIAKLAATSTIEKRYVKEFGFLHTSTFAEDEFSSQIGLKVLEILEERRSDREAALEIAKDLKRQLCSLQERYPSIIKEVRGTGLMLGVEFHEELKNSCYEFKIFNDSGVLGHFFASALLYNEGLRIIPTLSSHRTLRIAPSLFTDKSEAQFMANAIEALVKSIDSLI